MQPALPYSCHTDKYTVALYSIQQIDKTLTKLLPKRNDEQMFIFHHSAATYCLIDNFFSTTFCQLLLTNQERKKINDLRNETQKLIYFGDWIQKTTE